MLINNYHILLLAVVAFIIYILACNMVYDIGHSHYKSNTNILDIGYKFITDKRSNYTLYAVKEGISIILFILFGIFLCMSEKKLLYEYIITFLIVWIIKSILFSCTILPDPSNQCQKYNIFEPHKGSCHDLIISSHSAFLFIFLIIVFKYDLFPHMKYGLLALILFILYSIISLRQHYTMDIVHAFFYSLFVNFAVGHYLKLVM